MINNVKLNDMPKFSQPLGDFKPPHYAENEPAINRLKPKSEHHKRVLDYLLVRLRGSEERMKDFYPRWNVNEKKIQAYVHEQDYTEILKEINKNKNRTKAENTGLPQAKQLVVPYTFSTIATIVTYLMHSFTSRNPMFQVGTWSGDAVENALMMEKLLQYNSENTKLIKELFKFLTDGELYGLQILRTTWRADKRVTTVIKSEINPFTGQEEKVRVREAKTVFEGTDVKALDPFMFFPDWRVPMTEVNEKGEFVFWRFFEGDHFLYGAEAQGLIKYVDSIKDMKQSRNGGDESQRNLKANGDNIGGRTHGAYSVQDYRQLDQGTIEIIPSKMGLGPETVPTKYIFTIANQSQIIQAEKFTADHGLHPVAVGEPYSLGYGFGQAGLMDYLGPIQDAISWFLNSRIMNVRATINNQYIVDPSNIEMGDLVNPRPGGIIRTKKAAMGQDIRRMIQQLEIRDVTAGHINDILSFMRLGDIISAVNDNLRGVESAGGSRRSATESRLSAEAASSRLASHSKLISAQAITDLTKIMSSNYQQYLSGDFSLSFSQGESVNISPEHIVGDFNFPIHDGTLPLDRIALADIWKEIFIGLGQDPQLAQTYDRSAIFEFMAKLSGASNIEKFKLPVQGQVAGGTPEQLAQQAQAGNLIPSAELAKVQGMLQ